MSEQKLTSSQKHLLQLVINGRQPDGWAPVSKTLLPLVKKELPTELVEIESIGDEGRGRIRFTEQGHNVMMAMAWIGD